MSGWAALDEELDAWREAGRQAEFWWRDDDAVAATGALERLVGFSAGAGAPLMLAVIPAQAETGLADALAAASPLAVAQHGYAHHNYAPEGEKKMELGPHRPADIVIGELGAGWQRLQDLFGKRALPVLVPPWNRIAPHLVPMLPEMRYAGLSAFGPRNRAEPVKGFRQVNTHIDIIDWKGTRGFVGDPAGLEAAIAHLSAKRAGAADPAEPTGLLTHHLMHDPACWRFVERFIEAIGDHPAARWCPPAELFAPEAA